MWCVKFVFSLVFERCPKATCAAGRSHHGRNESPLVSVHLVGDYLSLVDSARALLIPVHLL